jgi:CDP-glycerol glycerophosphotransferase (TagB/SpsB family)
MALSKRNAARVKRVWDGLLNSTILPLSRLSPRKSNHWLFGHTEGAFAGNTKYLFLWISLYRPDITAVWIAENDETKTLIAGSGFLSYRRWSVSGIKAALRSKIFVYCHSIEETNTQLSGGALLLNLWHGVGLKPVMFGDKAGIMNIYRNKYLKSVLGYRAFYQYLVAPDILVTTSEFTRAHFSDQFEMKPERCPMLGYPRLDPSFDAKLRDTATALDAKSGFRFNPLGFKEVYIYMPTWRDSHQPFLAQALPDLSLLSAALRERGALLYIKLHPWTKEELNLNFDNIAMWPNDIEFYTYLAEFDSLITDYSSILYDYIFVKCSGAVLYTFDFDEWVTRDRGLLYPFEENTAGLRVSNFLELCAAITDGMMVQETRGVSFVREKFWGGCVPPVSPEIVRYVETAIASA